MKELLLAFALATIVILMAYQIRMTTSDYLGFGVEGFTNTNTNSVRDSDTSVLEGNGGNEPELAQIQQGLPLSDFLEPAGTGPSNLGADACARIDSARQTELDGQYVQRTNNYRHDNPDNCSSPLSEFVGAFYKLRTNTVGTTVPCAGSC